MGSKETWSESDDFFIVHEKHSDYVKMQAKIELLDYLIGVAKDDIVWRSLLVEIRGRLDDRKKHLRDRPATVAG